MQDNLAFIYPADISKAQKHRLANRIFKGEVKESSEAERCQCCDRRVGEEIPNKSCWYSPIRDLAFLGPGVPLLFVFVQNAMLALALLVILFFFYSLITNILGNSCTINTKCILDVFNELSISNKINDNTSLMVQTYLVAAYLLIYVVFLQYMIRRIRRRNEVCDEVINSPSDYSIIIKNLPEFVVQRDIEELVNEQRNLIDTDTKFKTKNLFVKKIIISYSLGEYLEERENQEEEFLKLKKEDENAEYHRAPLTKPTKTAKFAIVIFDSQIAKDSFFEETSVKKSIKNVFVNCCNNSAMFQVNGQPVTVERAPEPDDILWQNADIPKWKWVRNYIISYFFGIVILCGGGLIQYYLQYFQQGITDVTTRAYFSYATSIIVTLFNAIIVQFLIFVTKLQGNYTKTDLDRSLMVKICLYSFFNAGIFYSVANILAQSLNSFNIQGNFSFEVTLFMSINAFSPNIIGLILTKIQFPTCILQFFVKIGCMKKTQKDANKLYELTEVDFPVKYAYVIRTVWLTVFYAPFAPIIVPISVLGLIFFYFAETELFRSSYKVPNMLSMSITRTAIRLLDFTGIIFSSGQILIVFYIKFIFNSNFTLEEQIGVGLCILFSLVLIFLPSTKINQRLFAFKNKADNQPDYDEAAKCFEVTYEGTNPLSDPSERVRRNDLNFFKYLGFMDVFQVRKSSRSRHMSETPNPFLNLIASPNTLSPFGGPQQQQQQMNFPNQLQPNASNGFMGFMGQPNYGNQYGNQYGTHYGNQLGRQLGNHLL